eukprot:GCRY01002043.1.p1 GENE.GCRY01002043.1~~GCRY01002043.1.p1  ORF type:complete len:317 (+),score=39.32 GCRY01002043.1:221-1171(+)
MSFIYTLLLSIKKVPIPVRYYILGLCVGYMVVIIFGNGKTPTIPKGNFANTDQDYRSAFDISRHSLELSSTTDLSGCYFHNVHREMRVLSLGDSITQGIGVEKNFRGYLSTMLTSEASPFYNNVTFRFVGSQIDAAPGNVPEKGHQFLHHEGHYGLTVVSAREFIQEWIAEAVPDIVLIHLGTNDCVGGVDPLTFKENMKALVANICFTHPIARVIIAEMIPPHQSVKEKIGIGSPAGYRCVQDYNNALRKMVEEESQEMPCLCGTVDMFTPFRTVGDSLLRDTIHPNEQGHEVMAERWYSSILRLFSNETVLSTS